MLIIVDPAGTNDRPDDDWFLLKHKSDIVG